MADPYRRRVTLRGLAFSDYERFKWQVLYQSADYFGLDSPWYWARRIAPEDVAAQGELVSRATLELFDAGLIFCAYAARDDAYNMTFDEFVAVERNALEVELARDLEYIEPEDRLFWLLPTDTGAAGAQDAPSRGTARPRRPGCVGDVRA